MNKKGLTTYIVPFVTFLCLLISVPVNAWDLVPLKCSITNGQAILDTSYSQISLYYEGKIYSRNSLFWLYNGEEPYDSNSVFYDAAPIYYEDTEDDKVTVYTEMRFTIGYLVALAKGKEYRFTIPSGEFYEEDFPYRINKKFDITFVIPNSITAAPDAFVNIPDGLEGSTQLSIGFDTEIMASDEAKIILMREGKIIRTSPCRTSWNEGAGCVWMDFGKDGDTHTSAHFEKDVTYTLLLPEGSVGARMRYDITNEELSHSFVGGYTGDIDPLFYSACSLDDAGPVGKLEKVRFFYDRPVCTVSDPKLILQVSSPDQNIVTEEATACVYKDADKWVLEGDFGNMDLSSECEYEIIIPEATVTYPEGDIVVNKENRYRISEISGVENIGENHLSVTTSDGTIRIRDMKIGSKIRLYTADGNLLQNLTATDSIMSLAETKPGIYLLTVDSKTFKVTVK